jgi:hypothetical protein
MKTFRQYLGNDTVQEIHRGFIATCFSKAFCKESVNKTVERSPQVADSEKLQSLSIDELVREVRAREEAQSKAATVTEAPDLTPDPSLQDIDQATIVEKLQREQKVIYGVDDREDVFRIRNEKIRNDADSVIILCTETEVFDNGNGTSTLQTQNFGTAFNLCATEPFRDQPTTASARVFLWPPISLRRLAIVLMRATWGP